MCKGIFRSKKVSGAAGGGGVVRRRFATARPKKPTIWKDEL